MANTITPDERSRAELILARMIDIQTSLWDESLVLEKIIGCAVNTCDDLSAITIDDLMERDEPV